MRKPWAAVNAGIVVFQRSNSLLWGCMNAPPYGHRTIPRAVLTVSPSPSRHNGMGPPEIWGRWQDSASGACRSCRSPPLTNCWQSPPTPSPPTPSSPTPFLFHAEFMGLPPTAFALATIAAKQPVPCVPPGMLTGSPLVGGFDLLSLKAHTHARHAAMGCLLLRHLLASAPQQRLLTPAAALRCGCAACRGCQGSGGGSGGGHPSLRCQQQQPPKQQTRSQQQQRQQPQLQEKLFQAQQRPQQQQQQ